MAQSEIYGSRDLTYSAWHRKDSIKRFIGIEAAQTLSMIDIDVPIYVEYDDPTREPLLLVEAAIDKGQDLKPATVTMRSGMRSDLAAYTVLYTRSQFPNPADMRHYDVAGFRVRQLWPLPQTGQDGWHRMTPDQYAHWLLALRRELGFMVVKQSEFDPPGPRWSGTKFKTRMP